jgi:hypothetical protein
MTSVLVGFLTGGGGRKTQPVATVLKEVTAERQWPIYGVHSFIRVKLALAG